jgi:hypothetical protein
MPGDWGNLDCPNCGYTHPPPEGATTECEAVIADLICPRPRRQPSGCPEAVPRGSMGK